MRNVDRAGCRMLRFVKRAGFDFSFSRVGIARCGLCQGHFTVEVRLLFGAESEGHAAGRSDSLKHGERVPGVLGILQPGDHGLRRADLMRQFGLCEARVLAHFADQQRQVNLLQRANVFR